MGNWHLVRPQVYEVMTDPEHQEVSRNDMWDELNRQRGDITDVKSAIAGIGSKMDLLVHSAQANKPTPTNWTGVASLVVSVLVAGAIWVNHSLGPVKAKDNAQDADIARITEVLLEQMEAGKLEHGADRYTHGKLEAELTAIHERQELMVSQELVDVEARGRNAAKLEMLSRWVDKIDNMGSRVQDRIKIEYPPQNQP